MCRDTTCQNRHVSAFEIVTYDAHTYPTNTVRSGLTLPNLGSLYLLLPDWQQACLAATFPNMPTIRVKRMDHVAVDVTDMAATRAFYAGLLGLREIPRPQSFDFPGAWFETGSAVLHVVSRGQRDAIGRRHICFFVGNLKDAADAMRAAGFPVTDDGRGTIPGIERFYTVDPDGNRVEIQACSES
jgi:glyoxylase I family protein